MALTSGVLDAFAGDLVQYGEPRVPFLIPDLDQVPHIQIKD
jgi:hypothetical protein